MTRVGAIAVALAAIMLVGAPALAEQTKFPTRPTIKVKRKAGVDKLSGAVRSKAHACEAHRKVKIHHREVTQERKSSVIAKLRTNSHGKWTFRPKKNVNGDRYATPGDYQVKVGEKRIGGIVCQRKNSSSMYIG